MVIQGRPAYGPFPVKLAARDFFASGFCLVAVPRSARGVIISALDGLIYRDSWEGTKDEINLAMAQWNTIIVDMMACHECGKIECDEVTCGGASSPSMVYLESLQMGMFITDLTCEDGILYKHYGACCKVAIDCDLDSLITTPPPGTEIDPDDPTTWACNKAYGMAVTFQDVVIEVVAAISPFSSVYEMYSPCYDVIKRFGAVWGNAQQICAAYVANKSDVDVLAADPDAVQKMACIWSPLLLPTDNLNSDEFWSMQASFTVKFTTGQNAFLVPMTVALGLSNFAWWARLFHDSLAECGCPQSPGEIIGPTASGWYLDLAETQTIQCDGGFGWTPAYFRELAAHDAYGYHFTFEHMDANPVNNIKRHNTCNTPSPDVCFVQANSDDFAFGVDYCQMGNSAYAQLSPLLGAPNQKSDIPQWSDVVSTPFADAGETIEFSMAGQRDGAEGQYVLIKFTCRVLRNINSPSHA